MDKKIKKLLLKMASANLVVVLPLKYLFEFDFVLGPVRTFLTSDWLFLFQIIFGWNSSLLTNASSVRTVGHGRSGLYYLIVDTDID